MRITKNSPINVNVNLKKENVTGNVIANISSYFAKPVLLNETKNNGTGQKKKMQTDDNSIKNSQQTYGRKTLDEQHTEKINYFKQINETDIPKLLELKNNPKQAKQIGISIEKIDDINKKIEELKNEEKTYLLKNSKYIFQYFEEKKNISGNNKPNNVHSFFTTKQTASITSGGICVVSFA